MRAASRTAQGSALLRAAHLVLDRPPWLFEDRHALRLVGPWARRLLRAPWLMRLAERVEPVLGPVRAQALVRSRYAEDRLRDAIGRGVRQYVVVSAGLDSFAWRESAPARVFEVDHPASQRAKRERLAALDPAAASRAVFVPVDLKTDALDAVLVHSGFAADAPAFFSWLGTTYYLRRAAVERTLGALARAAAPGSELVLDYLLPESLLTASDTRRLRSVLRFARGRGEPVRSAFHPLAIAAAMRAAGWDAVEDLSAAAQQRAYLAYRDDGLRVPSWNRLVRARRGGAA